MLLTFLLLLCGCYKAEEQGGGIQMKIGEHGLNEVISYLLEHSFIPYVQHDLEVNNFNLEMGSARILIERLQLHTLDGQYGRVNISHGNTVGVTVGFKELALKTNLTRVAGDDVIYAPKTVIYFMNCSLQVTFSLGNEQNKDGVTLETCKATIGNFKAEGNLGSALQGLYLLSGSESFTSIVEQICPTLENITNENLKDILSVQDTVSISSSTYGQMSVNMKLLSASTETHFITMVVEVTTEADGFVGNVDFPRYDQTQGSLDAVLLMNDDLLSSVCKHTIQEHIFKNFVLKKIINAVEYSVEVNGESIQSKVVSTAEGASVVWNVTIAVYTTSDNCVVYQLGMDSIIPVVFGFNDTLIDLRADIDRFQTMYMVSSWNKACTKSEKTLDTSKSVQKELLQQLKSEFDRRLKVESVSFKLPKDKWYGFNDPHIKSVEGGMAFSSSFRVGENNQITIEKLKHVYNTQYNSHLTTYVYSDGERDNHRGRTTLAPPVSNSVLHTYCIPLIVIFTIVLIIIHN